MPIGLLRKRTKNTPRKSIVPRTHRNKSVIWDTTFDRIVKEKPKGVKPMYVSTSEIVQKANSIVAQCGTRDPLRIARDLGIEVMYYPFNEQRGAYKVLMRNRFIFVKNDLHPVMENIVLLHELGHDALHREEATKVGGFKEFEIFNMRDNRMEYEANLFAAQISLSDEDFLELAERGYDTQQIARTLNSDINLVALKGRA